MKSRANPWRRAIVLSVLALPVAGLTGCEAAQSLVFEPEITDPLDGYEGSLSQAGINTEVDWGPKQSHLLSEHQKLIGDMRTLRTEHENTLAEKQNLLTQLDSERTELEREKGLRAQSEAETERLRSKSREYEARILELSIDKAKLEQELLLKQIEVLNTTINSLESEAVPATASPGRRP